MAANVISSLKIGHYGENAIQLTAYLDYLILSLSKLEKPDRSWEPLASIPVENLTQPKQYFDKGFQEHFAID